MLCHGRQRSVLRPSVSSTALETSEICKASLRRECISEAYLYCSISSFVWKSEWGPDYHQSMFIGIAALAFATALSIGPCNLLHFPE